MSLEQIGLAARVASRVLAGASTTAKAEALRAIADALEANAATIIAANELDLSAGRAQGLSVGLLDRLTLNKERIAQIAAATRQVCALPDPVGVVSGGHRRPNGLEIVQVRVPLGVVGMIYEARPNVTVDAAALCLYSGNAAVLRGSASAIESNKVLVALMRGAIADAGLPADAVQLIEDTSRESVTQLMRLREYIDVLIPRGGADLIRTVVDGASVPVIETGVGNCHVYVDAAADASAAIPIVLNAKVSRPSVCNAAETLLVHRAIAGDFLPKVVAELIGAGVEVRGDEATQAVSSSVIKATDDDYRAEFGDLIMAVKVVESLDEAIEHVNEYGSRHTEAILTQDYAAAQRFAADVDAACIMINASTRFADGSEFGMGAEIGISTQKLHARGPFALEALTTVKWIVRGSGQTR